MQLPGRGMSPLEAAQEWVSLPAPTPGVAQLPVHCQPTGPWGPLAHVRACNLAGSSTVAAAVAILRSKKHFKKCKLVANFKNVF